MVPSGVHKHTCQSCATVHWCTPMTQRKNSSRTSCPTWRMAKHRDSMLYYNKLSRMSPETPGKPSSTSVRPVSAALVIRRSALGGLFLGPRTWPTGTSRFTTLVRSASVIVATWLGSSAAK